MGRHSCVLLLLGLCFPLGRTEKEELMSTREEAIALRRKYPCMTLEVIGAKCGVTRERVRQVLSAEGLETVALHKHYHICPECHCKVFAKWRTFCSPTCHWRYHHVTVQCSNCGALRVRLASHIEVAARRGFAAHFFCNKFCHGQWLGKNYGNGHRKNIDARLSGE